jgi:hypothetical protein
MFCCIVYIDHDLLHRYLRLVVRFVKSLLKPKGIFEVKKWEEGSEYRLSLEDIYDKELYRLLIQLLRYQMTIYPL